MRFVSQSQLRLISIDKSAMLATAQVRAHLVELLRLPGAASPPRHIVIHRDGPAWQSEQVGARQAVIQLRGERVLDPDATPPILEVSKSAPAPLRLFEVTGSETRPWVETPQVGAPLIAENDAYPLLPPVVTALAVVLPHLPGLQSDPCSTGRRAIPAAPT
jgi:hypothetical protein